MNDLAVQQAGTSVVAPGGNYFQSYGDQASQKSIVGQLLKFNKGDFLAGENEDPVKEGTKLIANMDELMVGWVRWFDKKPTDQIMGRVSEGYQPGRRGDLGDTNKDEWETDREGRAQDPWAFANYLILKEVDGDELYTFTTSSKGGINAIGELCKAYGKAMRQHPDEHPIIELDTDSYNHKEYGRVKTPKLKLVGWAPKSAFADALEGDGDEPGPEQQPEAAPAKGTKAKGKDAAAQTRF